MQLWDINDHPYLNIKGRFQRDENGDEVWVVSAKRMWSLTQNEWLSADEVEIFDDPLYAGEPGFSAMIHDHEFAIHKHCTDVVVSGKARAYAKRPVEQMECRLLLDGHIDKTLVIRGQRDWIEHGGSITVSNPQSFIDCDIDYARAIGGEDERNRIGGGVASSNKVLLTQRVPSVFYPKEDWDATSKKVRVAGFGPIPPFFKQRYQLAGTFDDNWLENRRPMLPVDFDRRYYQSAPLDQQCKGYLQGGERLMLSGFSHDDIFSFRLPREKYRASADFGDDQEFKDLELYTVFVDTEKGVVSLTYSAAFACQEKEHLLKSTSIQEVVENTNERGLNNEK